MKPIKCDKCGKLFTSKFCPDCGQNREDIKIVLPTKLTTYVHGSDEDGWELCEKYGIDENSELGRKISRINYEVKIVYEIIDNDLIMIEVDGKKLVDK